MSTAVATATSSRKGIGGPKTPEGKKRVSLNAMKHGLTATSPQGLEAISQEIGASYEQVLDEMRTHYSPRDFLEDRLVQRIARCFWRIMITQMKEDKHLEIRGANMLRPSKSYEKIIRHERMIDIQLHRAIAVLERKREKEAKEKLQNKLIEGHIPSSNPPISEREFVLPDTHNMTFQEKYESNRQLEALRGGEPVPDARRQNPVPARHLHSTPVSG